MREGWINERERIKTEIGTGDNLRDGCAMGVQLAIDELKANTGRNIEILQLNVFDYEDADGDGECWDLRGYSYVRVDKEAWKADIASIEDFYATIGDRLPKELRASLDTLKENLK